MMYRLTWATPPSMPRCWSRVKCQYLGVVALNTSRKTRAPAPLEDQFICNVSQVRHHFHFRTPLESAPLEDKFISNMSLVHHHFQLRTLRTSLEDKLTSRCKIPGALLHHFQLRTLRTSSEDKLTSRCQRPGHLLGVGSLLQLCSSAITA